VWGSARGRPWVLEDAKVERLLVGLDAPGDAVSCRDVDPANEVRLDLLSSGYGWGTSIVGVPCCGLRCFPCPPWLRAATTIVSRA
jgi:hypothetical protein